MKYTWGAPRFEEGQVVNFWGHKRGNNPLRPLYTGLILDLETHYIHGKAHHSYEIRPDGWQPRCRIYIGEESIIGIVK